MKLSDIECLTLEELCAMLDALSNVEREIRGWRREMFEQEAAEQ